MLKILPRYAGVYRMRSLLAFANLLIAGISHAQVTHDHSPASPGAATANVGLATPVTVSPSPLSFVSTLSRYQAMTDQKLGSWRDANDTVTRIGGWRSYLKEAQAPDVKTTLPPALPGVTTAPTKPPAPPTTNPHAGHGAKP